MFGFKTEMQSIVVNLCAFNREIRPCLRSMWLEISIEGEFK